MPDPALDSLLAALALSPENLPLRRLVGLQLLAAARFEEAGEVLRPLLRSQPDDIEAQMAMIRCLDGAGHPDQADVLSESALEASDDPRLQLLQAQRLLAQGQDGPAALLYGKAIEADPNLAEAELSARLGARPGRPLAQLNNGDTAQLLDQGLQALARDAERPRITFADVGGMEALKEQVRLRIIHPLKNPEIYRSYGKSIGGGLLLYGPPGCGKTHLARATAGEIQAGFLSVGVSDILDMYHGESERKLHEIFRLARLQKPFVLFFDEIDALAANRRDLRQSAGKTLINQFLAEFDGADASNDGLLVLGATNAPWHLDPAFRRPGRFDRVLFVPPPDEAARASILQIHLKGKPAEGVDLSKLAKLSPRYSGADLRGLVDAAIEGKISESMRSGVAKPLRTEDLVAALKVVKPGSGEWFSTARNHALFSNQSGQYDEVLAYLKDHEFPL